jgi:hypothetical protein
VASDKILMYATSASQTKTPYTGPVTVGAISWIEFWLYQDSTMSALLDQERIYVAQDGTPGTPGANSIIVDIENENTSINCDAYGVPYPGELPMSTRAFLYDGGALASAAWSLESPPAGVSIAQDGTITVAANAALGRLNRVKVQAVYRGVAYARVFTLGKTLDGESPIVLDLFPPVAVIQCDYLGNPLGGEPVTTLATLYTGTQEITEAMGLAEAARVEILHYPGDLYDPMLGDLYPTPGYPVAWSLVVAPAGAAIDSRGLVTVSDTGRLNDTNSITARATYHGKTYDALFGISKSRAGVPAQTFYTWIKFSDNADGTGLYDTPTDNTQYIGIAANKPSQAESTNKADYIWSRFKGADGLPGANGYVWIRYADNAQGGGMSNDGTGKNYIGLAHNKETATESNNPADYQWSLYKGADGLPGDSANVPKYRGVTNAADTGNIGKVTVSGVLVTMNDLDWVLFMGDVGWTKARLYQWHGKESVWTMLPPAQSTLQYKEALRDITEGAPDGIFSNMFCKILFAQQAAINTLQSKLIQVQNAIFGGERFDKSQDGNGVVDNGADKIGFILGADGIFRASNAVISGIINAFSGRFSDVEILGNSLFQGNITSGPLVLSTDSPTGSTYVLNSGASAITIRNKIVEVSGENLETGSYSVIGSYNGKQLVQIKHIYDYKSPNGNSFELSIYAYYNDGTSNRIAFRKEQNKDVVTNDTISNSLTFTFTTEGKTFKLMDIPTYGVTTGVVYKDANGFLKIG